MTLRPSAGFFFFSTSASWLPMPTSTPLLEGHAEACHRNRPLCSATPQDIHARQAARVDGSGRRVSQARCGGRRGRRRWGNTITITLAPSGCRLRVACARPLDAPRDHLPSCCLSSGKAALCSEGRLARQLIGWPGSCGPRRREAKTWPDTGGLRVYVHNASRRGLPEMRADARRTR